MAGLFVMLRFIKKRVAPAQFESRLYSTCICSRADNVTRTVSLPSGTNMTALHTYTGLHIIAGNINFSYASGGMRAYDISFGGNMKNITALLS